MGDSRPLMPSQQMLNIMDLSRKALLQSGGPYQFVQRMPTPSTMSWAQRQTPSSL